MEAQSSKREKKIEEEKQRKRQKHLKEERIRREEKRRETRLSFEECWSLQFTFGFVCKRPETRTEPLFTVLHHSNP